MSAVSASEDLDRLILPNLYRHFDIPSASSFEVRKTSRLYSSVWKIKVSYGGKTSGFYVKTGGGKAPREFALCSRANDLMKGQSIYAPIDIYYDEEHDLLFASEFQGVSLEELASGFWSHPWAWYGEIRRVASAAGTWLRAYHSLDRTKGNISEALLGYAKRRETALVRLSAPLRGRMMDLIASAGETDVATIHSDFSPGNIIWGENKVGIIDYGINEWLLMSPWWDILTFEILLQRYMQLSKRTPLFLLPAMRTKILADFASAYGDIAGRGGNAFLACAAVRHLSLIRARNGNAGELDSVSRWHLQHLEQILQRAGA